MAKKAAAFILLFIAFWRIAPAQTITARLDRDKIVLGEQVTLELKLEGLNTANSFLTEWFDLPDTSNHIQIIRRDTVDTIEVAGLTSYLQHITITSFDSGKWAIPLPKLFIQNKATGKKTALKAETVFLQVLPVDVSSLQDYHVIKDIIVVPVKQSYVLLVAGIISGIVVIVLAFLLLTRKRKPLAAPSKPAQFINPIDEALQKIQALKQEGLPAKGQTVLFYTRLDDICRAYFTRRMQIKAMQCTSDELIIKLNVYLQNRDSKTKFCQLLRLADAVKFAKYLPAEQQHEEALQHATASLQYIETQLQIANRHVN
jgi:hypothetical protein